MKRLTMAQALVRFLAQQYVERAEPDHIVDHRGGERLLFLLVQQKPALIGDLDDQLLDPRGKLRAGHVHRRGGLDLGQDLIVDQVDGFGLGPQHGGARGAGRGQRQRIAGFDGATSGDRATA